VAERLGFRLIDQDIVTRAAVGAGVDKEVIADVEQRKSGLMKLIEGLSAAGMAAGYGMAPVTIHAHGQPATDDLRKLIQSVIEEVAAAGEVVIVAHAASLALAEREGVLRVFLTASPETREQRVGAARGIAQTEASRAVKQSDAGRADYIKRFYRIGEELPIHYDLVINTDKLTPEQASELIVHAATGSVERQLPVA